VSFEQYKLAVQTYVRFLADPEYKPIEVQFPRAYTEPRRGLRRARDDRAARCRADLKRSRRSWDEAKKQWVASLRRLFPRS
jgi:hypothetical protein